MNRSETQSRVAEQRRGLLQDKVAIITGASRGIGAASARVFAGAGASVVLAARDERALAAVAQDIVAAGGRALVVPTDVGDAAAVEQLVKRTLDAYGRLDAAFNNAGISHPPIPLADISVDDFDQLIRTDLRGIFLCMKYEIPAMLASGGGAIVNMSSTAGVSAWPGLADYAASKHGLIGLSKTAALDYAAQNVRVNAVAPGSILTGGLAQAPEQYRIQAAQAAPIHRVGQPEEVGAVAAWLCSDQASYVTGVTIPIDGGQLARIG